MGKASIQLTPDDLRTISIRAHADDKRFGPLAPTAIGVVRAGAKNRPLRIGDVQFASVREAARYLRCSTTALYAAIAAGRMAFTVHVPASWIEKTEAA